MYLNKSILMSFLFFSSAVSPAFAVVSDAPTTVRNSPSASASAVGIAGASSSVYNHSANSAIQGQTLDNVNTASGGNASVGSASQSVNDNSVNTFEIPRQAPPAIAPNVAAPGNNGFSGGFSTPFGGISLGKTTVDGSVKQLNRATADALLVDAMIKVQACGSAECVAFKKYLLKRFK